MHKNVDASKADTVNRCLLEMPGLDFELTDLL